MKKNIVLVFGTFDLFHKGHRFFLSSAKKYGDRLVVIISRDKNVTRFKGKPPCDTERQRQTNVAQHPDVDEARLGYENWNTHKKVLEDIHPDVVCLGYDQRMHIPKGLWTIVRIQAFHSEQYKSSLLRQQKKTDHS